MPFHKRIIERVKQQQEKTRLKEEERIRKQTAKATLKAEQAEAKAKLLEEREKAKERQKKAEMRITATKGTPKLVKAHSAVKKTVGVGRMLGEEVRAFKEEFRISKSKPKRKRQSRRTITSKVHTRKVKGGKLVSRRRI